MNIETNRLNTFANWPASAPVDPIRIAKAGFFYTGEGTEVQCFSCGGKISQWNYGDQVMWRHRNLEPNCAFVVNPQLSGNVPLVLGGSGRECPTNGSRVSREIPDSSGNYGATEEDDMYKSDALRLLSFVNWDDPSVSRESLVSAGFYHVGEGRLRCAWCGGELAPFRNFGSLGHPLIVHRMYFPRCAYAARLELAEAQRGNDVHVTSSSPPTYTPPLQSPAENATRPQSSGAAHNEQLLQAGNTWRSLGVVGGGARHPAHAALASRLSTFERWPADRTQTPRGLAEAGFFYTGTDDQVTAVSKYPAYIALDTRLSTFERWPADRTQTPRGLAEAGFFYTGTDDQVTEVSRYPAYVALATRSSTVERWPADRTQTPRGLAEAGFFYTGTDDQVTVVSQYPAYVALATRLSTFERWPADRTQTPRGLAEAGFFYTGTDDQVTEVSQSCAYVALAARLSTFERWPADRTQTPRGLAEAGFFYTGTDDQSSAYVALAAKLSTYGFFYTGTDDQVTVVSKYPAYVALAARLSTFERWPADRTQTPRGLAEAGFFYTGTDDQVRCFYCDGGLGRWEAGDAPWAEHARWFPHCGYVLLVKGQQFVDSCRVRVSILEQSELSLVWFVCTVPVGVGRAREMVPSLRICPASEGSTVCGLL
ncbi:inhibitor of apoptosis domain-containing protein [Phthorimaea operculella]|nr:inhibitor of apoptosis domain-containing protein [Phthorimaea operculella]